MSDRTSPTDEIAAAILRYLVQNPQAADTLEGIRTWWLRSQGLEPPEDSVARALQKLIDEGEMIRVGAAASAVYRRPPP